MKFIYFIFLYIFSYSLYGAANIVEKQITCLTKTHHVLAASDAFDYYWPRVALVKDHYRALSYFPRISYSSARAIHPSEVTQVLDLFYTHAVIVKKFAESFEGFERESILSFSAFIQRTLSNFSRHYSSFDATSLTLAQMVVMSNYIKGKGFEMLVQNMLYRAGFSVLNVNIPFNKAFQVNTKSSQIRPIKNGEVRPIKKRQVRSIKNEIDIVASKDNNHYIFEVKSMKPVLEVTGYIKKNYENIYKQVRDIRSGLNQLSGVPPQYVLIFHFDLGEEFRQKLLQNGADKVIYLRAEYLDDYEKYF